MRVRPVGWALIGVYCVLRQVFISLEIFISILLSLRTIITILRILGILGILKILTLLTLLANLTIFTPCDPCPDKGAAFTGESPP